MAVKVHPLHNESWHGNSIMSEAPKLLAVKNGVKKQRQSLNM
jgi:hypothetical protein